jgi:hypothetical protein
MKRPGAAGLRNAFTRHTNMIVATNPRAIEPPLRWRCCDWLRAARFSLCLISVLLPSIAARGQGALFSALSLDRAIEANTNAPVQTAPEGHHLGPVPFSLGAYINASYNDNINETQDNRESDIILGAGVNLGVSWAPTGQSQLQLGSGIGYDRYLKNADNSGLIVTPDSSLIYSFTLEDVKVTLFDQFSYTREVVSEGALANVGVSPQLDNTIGTRVAWNPNQWTFQAGYSHETYISDQGGQDLSRSSEYFFTRGGWLFAEGTEAGLEASDSLTSYEVETQNNSTGISVGAYANWQLLQSLNLTLRGGPTFYTFNSGNGTAGTPDLLSYYVNLEASQQLTDFLSHQLSIDRSVQPGLNAGSAYIEQLVATYSAYWALTPRIRLGTTFTYENGSQPFPVVLPGGLMSQSIEHYELYGVQPQIFWQLTDKFSGSLGYSYWLRQSNVDGRNYLQNSVTCGFVYTF